MLWFVLILTAQPYTGANYASGIVLSSLQISYLIFVTTSWERYYSHPHFVFIDSLLSIGVNYPKTKENVAIPSLNRRKLVTFSSCQCMSGWQIKSSPLMGDLDTSFTEHLLSPNQHCPPRAHSLVEKTTHTETNKLPGPVTSTLEARTQYSTGGKRK